MWPRLAGRGPGGLLAWPGPTTLISLASKALQLFPVPSPPPEQHGNSQEESE